MEREVEWGRLRKAAKQGCWDESKVREYDDIVREVRRDQRKAHFGKIFEVCVDKNFQLPETDPARKFKGRVVYQGNNVRDEHGDAAFCFQDLSSCPAIMEATKCADWFALIDGNVGQLYAGRLQRHRDMGPHTHAPMAQTLGRQVLGPSLPTSPGFVRPPRVRGVLGTTL